MSSEKIDMRDLRHNIAPANMPPDGINAQSIGTSATSIVNTANGLVICDTNGPVQLHFHINLIVFPETMQDILSTKKEGLLAQIENKVLSLIYETSRANVTPKFFKMIEETTKLRKDNDVYYERTNNPQHQD